MNIEDAARENKLAELDIARQVVEDKNQRIWELEKKIELLEKLLNQTAALRAGFPQPQPQPLPAIRTFPKRWSVR